MATTDVITRQSPDEFRIDVCKACEQRLTAEAAWPKDRNGREYAQVWRGLHPGICAAPGHIDEGDDDA